MNLISHCTLEAELFMSLSLNNVVLFPKRNGSQWLQLEEKQGKNCPCIHLKWDYKVYPQNLQVSVFSATHPEDVLDVHLEDISLYHCPLCQKVCL